MIEARLAEERDVREMEPQPLHAVSAEPFALELWGITKRWPGAPAPVLQEVDLCLAPGSVTWLVGANGAGKTTLLRIASGLMFPDAGAVFAGDLHPRAQRRDFERRVGFLSAMNHGLYARLSVRQHLDFWARLAWMPPQERGDAVARVIEEFCLEDLARARVDRLSMGQRQRVRLAGVFLQDPRVVLLDEPRNSLDEEGQRLVDDALDRVLDRRGAILWAGPKGEQPPRHVNASYELREGQIWPL